MAITLADIAEKAGVNKSTVSLALRGSPRVREATRQKIEQIAHELGYKPDPRLTILSAYRWGHKATLDTNTVGYLETGRRDFGDFISRVESGLQRSATALGYEIDRFRVEDYGNLRRLADIMQARGIQGVIVGSVQGLAEWDGLPWERFAVVCAGVGYVRLPFHAVRVNYFQGVLIAWEKARAAGYQRIGLAVMQSRHLSEEDTRRIAAAYYCQRMTAMSEDETEVPVLTSRSQDQESFLEWFDRWQPDCVIAFHDGVLWWLTDHGLRVPEEVAFVSLQVDRRDTPRKDIAGIDRRDEMLGEKALVILDQALRYSQFGYPAEPLTTLVDPIWQEGKTMPPKHKIETPAII